MSEFTNVKAVSVGSLQKGKYVVVDGVASIVSDVSVSRPGKHGHAKVNLSAVGILDGKKRNLIMPGHDHIDVPVIAKKNAQVLSVTGSIANVMDTENFETFDVSIPEDIDGVVEGSIVVYWIILNDKVIKQVKE